MPIMTPHTVASFKTRLQARRVGLLEQIALLRGGPIGRAEASAAHFGQKEDSSAQLATEREIEFALDEHETTTLGQVDAALRRIAAGTYGQCTDCGEPIPPPRLEATPEVARCISCQVKAE
jgi:DnaK suppressor protein